MPFGLKAIWVESVILFELKVFLVSVCRKSETQDEGVSSQLSHPSPRYHRDFGSESLLLKSCSVIPADERCSIHEANINILNAKTEQQLKEDRVT